MELSGRVAVSTDINAMIAGIVEMTFDRIHRFQICGLILLVFALGIRVFYCLLSEQVIDVSFVLLGTQRMISSIVKLVFA